LPRRLGDDPLTRARAEKGKAAGASTSAAPEPGAQQGPAQAGVQTFASYNDVFFQRRGGSSDFEQTAEARSPEAPERPEISEISEIPEIREVGTASGSQAAVEVAAEARTGAATTEVAQAPHISTTEEAVPSLNATPPAAITEANEEPATQEAAAPAPSSGPDGPVAEPQKGGFFKRLFGKFK
jgi:hypothetical protein